MQHDLSNLITYNPAKGDTNGKQNTKKLSRPVSER